MGRGGRRRRRKSSSSPFSPPTSGHLLPDSDKCNLPPSPLPYFQQPPFSQRERSLIEWAEGEAPAAHSEGHKREREEESWTTTLFFSGARMYCSIKETKSHDRPPTSRKSRSLYPLASGATWGQEEEEEKEEKEDGMGQFRATA